MAAPLIIAGKVLLQAAVTQVNKKYPGGIIGLVATVVIFSIFVVVIFVGGIIGLGTMLSPKTNGSDQCVLFPDSGDSADAPMELDYTGSDEVVVTNPGNIPLSSGKVIIPLAAGTYSMSSAYGPRVSPGGIGSTYHLGTDFRAPQGTAIFSVADGVVVHASAMIGLGQAIAIQHNINGQIWVSRYGHTLDATKYVKVGDTVTAGQQIGEVGLTGNTTGYHLHFEIWKNAIVKGNSIDPEPWLAANGAITVTGSSNPDIAVTGIGGNAGSEEICVLPSVGSSTGSAGPWGGFNNGEIPAEALKPIPWATNQMLRADATDALTSLNVAFNARFGYNIGITDSYRSYAEQVELKRTKGYLAGTPGTSNHGWALALDLATQINVSSSETHKWFQDNAPAYGWINPAWAQPGGSKFEPWHWEYVGTNGASAGDGTTPDGAKAMAKEIMATYGWGDAEYNCLVPMWTRESGWNYKAANNSSTARGIPQAMMSVHFGGNWATSDAGKAYLNTPSVQIKWGLDYIKGRYSTPCGAASWWNSNHWY